MCFYMRRGYRFLLRSLLVPGLSRRVDHFLLRRILVQPTESNRRGNLECGGHAPYPTLLHNLATRRGLEPLASAVTGRRYNQLNYRANVWWRRLDLNQQCQGRRIYSPLGLPIFLHLQIEFLNALRTPVVIIPHQEES